MKTITREQYFHAMSLYIIAKRKQIDVDALESELNMILRDEQGSHASDGIYDYANKGTKEEFDKILELMDIEVISSVSSESHQQDKEPKPHK